MTRDMAVAEAKKKVATVKTDGSVPGGRRELTMAEWMEAVEKRAKEIMAGHTVRQLSPMFDAPSTPRNSSPWRARRWSAVTCTSSSAPP